jgi:hypothetical protein
MLRDGSPAVAALPAARGALDEHCLVGTDASDMSALAGASAGTVGATLRTRKQKTELQPLETGTSGGATTHLKVEKPRFLFLEGLADAAVAPVAATAALLDASAARAGDSTACATPSMDRRWRVLPRPPRAPAPLPPLRLLATGVGVSTSRGEPAPITLFFPLVLRRQFLWGRQGESPCCSRSWYLLTDKRRIHLQSASVRTYTFFTTEFPRFLSIRGARGLQVFDLPLRTRYSNPNYDYTRKQLNYTRDND